MLLDAHAHPDMYDDVEAREAIEEMERDHILIVATSMDFPSYERAKRLGHKSRNFVPAFGVHPWNAHLHGDQLDAIREAARTETVLAEIGLDYRRIQDLRHYPLERAVFQIFLDEAASRDHLLSIHLNGAEGDAWRMMRGHDLGRVIIHSYSGDLDSLKRFIGYGCYFSVGPRVRQIERLRDIVREIPADRLLTETDGPGQRAPETGKRGTPGRVRESLAGIAEVKGMRLADVEALVLENYRRLIKGLPLPESW